MTISSTNTKNSYSGDGATVAFSYTFKILDDDDIQVILRTNATGTETVQTKTTHYTVSGVGNAGGGTITFVSAPAATETVVLIRAIPLTQTTDYTPNDPFPAATHEDALDKLTLMAQDTQEEVDRSIKLSRTNTMTSTEFTVGATTRANKIFAFDSSGELAVTQEIGTFQGDWAASTAYAERDLVKDTSTNNIFIVNAAHTSSGSQPLTTNTNSSKYDLIVDAAAATTSATNAASSATAAAASATAAAASESAAATSESNAAASEAGVAADAAAAAASASSASTSATNASTSETNASNSASAASTSATNAATSATSASNSASAASTSATNAATSESNASDSADAASTSASNAASSASSASTSETNAASSASGAASDASAAAASAAAAAASFDAFDDIYLGAKASAPTVDNDGDALTNGDLYFDTGDNELYIWNGSAWQAASPNIVADTTPQLGGDLDTNGNDITFGDNDKAIFGAGSDFAISHNSVSGNLIEMTANPLELHQAGANSVLQLYNDGASHNQVLQILKGGTLHGGISTDTGKLKIDGVGSLELSDDGSTKLATTATGVDVTGVITTDGITEDTSGNVGIGGSAVLSSSAYNAASLHLRQPGSTTTGGQLRFTTGASGHTASDGAFISYFSDNNLYYNNQESGDHRFFNGGSERMRIDSSGLVGIGVVPSGTAKLQVNGQIYASSDGSASAPAFAVNDGDTGMFRPANNNLAFTTGGSERMRIDSSGNFLVGKTASGVANTGAELQSSGFTSITRDGGPPLQLNRKTSDGDLFVAKKDGTTVGSIGASGGNVIINSASAYGILQNAGSNQYVWSSSGGASAFYPEANNSKDLGTSTKNFKDLYLSGGAYLGGTAAANKLDDYEEGTFTPALGGTGTTYTTQRGNYTKIGNLVYINFDLRIDSIGSGSTDHFGGLPYSASYESAISIEALTNLATAVSYINFRISGTAIYGYYSASSTTWTTLTANPNYLGDGTIIQGSGVYITSA